MTRGRRSNRDEEDGPWTVPRRTMSNPASLRAVRRVCIPSGLMDLVLNSKAAILEEQLPPKEFPSWPSDRSGAVDAPAAVQRDDSASERTTPSAAVNDDESRTAKEHEERPLCVYSPAEFRSLQSAAITSAAVHDWRQATFGNIEGSAASLTPSRSILGEALEQRSPAPSARKKYFEHSELHHKVIAVLNKVSSDLQKYAEVRNELHRLPLPSTDDQFTKVVGVFFSKAVQEPQFSEQYAQLVAELVNSPGRATGAEDQSFAVRFKKALVDRCQEEYIKSRDRLANADRDDDEEVTLSKAQLRGTLNFVAHLYLQRMLAPFVVIDVLGQLTCQPPSDGDVYGVLAILKACGPQLGKEDPYSLIGVMHACQAYADDQAIPLPKRVRFLCLDVVDLIRAQVPAELMEQSLVHVGSEPPPFDGAGGMVVPVPLQAVDENLAKIARRIMAELSETNDFEKALSRVLQESDHYGLMLGWIHRAVTTTRAEKERQQLPRFIRFLVDRNIFDVGLAQQLFVDWACIAVATREWTNSPQMWKHWAVLLSEDKSKDAVATQELHNICIREIIMSPNRDLPADLDLYLEAVLKVNLERTWDFEIVSASKAHRFRYLAHLVASCGAERIADLPLATVRKIGLPLDDVEARIFTMLMEGTSPWEFIRSHPQVLSLCMVQKVMGAILAASVARQDNYIAIGAMDLLHIVVDGPDRPLREALLITELMSSGSLMHGHMRSSAFGFQFARALTESEVIAETTMHQARERYGGDPNAIHLIGPNVAQPFISGGAVGYMEVADAPGRADAALLPPSKQPAPKLLR